MGLLILGLSLLLNPPAPAQGQEDLPEWKIDPYTENQRERFEAAGYAEYHRFLVTDSLGTSAIMATLGEVEMIWVESAHFKIGCSLPAYKIPTDKIQKEKLAVELDRLREKLPEIPKKVKILDRWLRVHLFAQRLEDQYQDFLDMMHVTADDFPDSGGQRVNGKVMGDGPYFGQKRKFIVLLCEKKSTIHRFASTYCGGQFQQDSPITHNFPRASCMLYGTCNELADGYFYDDSRLHCNVAFGLAHNMLRAYRGYRHELPVWLIEGVAHCYVNTVDERYHNFSRIKDAYPNERKLWQWQPRVRNLVRHEAFLPFTEIARWTTVDDWRIGHHMNLWSRVDYLSQLEGDGMARFIDRMSDLYQVRPGLQVTTDQIMQRQDEVFSEIWSFTIEELDARWVEWVEDTYPKK